MIAEEQVDIQHRRGDEGGILSDMSFSPDGMIIASVGVDGTIKLWNVTNGNVISSLQGHIGSIRDITFSPDGKVLASASYDKTIEFWDVKNTRVISKLSGYRPVTNISFSPDKKLFASASIDGRIRLWSMKYLSLDDLLDNLLARGCRRLYNYLKNNPVVNVEDRSLCDDVLL